MNVFLPNSKVVNKGLTSINTFTPIEGFEASFCNNSSSKKFPASSTDITYPSV